jgi:acyl-coenzyme A thioesterase PaaI-like protein
VFVRTDGRLYTATISMTVNFLAPAKPGPITGEATVTQTRQDRGVRRGQVDGR